MIDNLTIIYRSKFGVLVQIHMRDEMYLVRHLRLVRISTGSKGDNIPTASEIWVNSGRRCITQGPALTLPFILFHIKLRHKSIPPSDFASCMVAVASKLFEPEPNTCRAAVSSVERISTLAGLINIENILPKSALSTSPFLP